MVGVFNFGEARPEQIYLNWKELGIPDSAPGPCFRFLEQGVSGRLGSGDGVESSPRPAAACLTLLPASGQIQLVSTNRHITQGWVDLVSLKSGPAANSFAGKSKVIKNDPYELFFAFPRGKNFAVKTATARTAAGALPVRTVQPSGLGDGPDRLPAQPPK